MNILITEHALNFVMMGVWLAVFIAALVFEVSTAEVVSIWFCIGAIFALIFTFIPKVPIFVEIIVFFVVSIISLFALRPLAKKWLKKGMPEKELDTIIGKEGTVAKLENNELLVKLNGVLWTANANQELKLNDKVVVTEVNGNKLLVEKKEV